jgi:hypothetical protein
MNFNRLDLDLNLVAGDYLAAEADLVEAGQHEQALAVRTQVTERDKRPRLGHRFYQQYAGHHRAPGEMSLEEGLVEGDVLDRDHPVFFKLEHTVDEQERIPMRQHPQHPVELGNLVLSHSGSKPCGERYYLEMVERLAAAEPNSLEAGAAADGGGS